MDDREKWTRAMDMFQSAEMNLENLARAHPVLALDPFFKIVRFQLQYGLWEAGWKEGEEPTIR